MNPWQMAQQLKHELQTVTWGTSSNTVFGNYGVFVYAGAPPSEQEHPPAFPFCLVTIGTATPDEDHPELLTQTFTVVVAVEVAGDPLGEQAVIGGARASQVGSSGAGIAQVAERVRFAIQNLTTYDGASIIVSGSGVGSPSVLGRGRQVVFDEYTVEALCTSQELYPAPQTLTASGSTWSWEAADSSNRYDLAGYVLAFRDGDTPGERFEDMTATVYEGNDLTVTHEAAPNRVYHVFAEYQPTGGSGSVRYSPVVLGSYLAL
jgi:hypothetical protein